MKVTSPSPPERREPAYLRSLLTLLGTITFFQGFSVAAAAVAVGDIADRLRVDDAGGLLVPALAFSIGALVAWPVSSLADRVGRRPMLVAATTGFAVFTGATALAEDLAAFSILQGIARIFLVSTLVIVVVVAVEEFPVGRRGYVVGVLGALGALGLPAAVAALVLLRAADVGYRGLFVIGALPLLIVPVLLRSLRETPRFGDPQGRGSLLRGETRREALIIGFMFLLVQFGVLAGITTFDTYATEEHGMDLEFVRLIQGAALFAGVFGYLFAGSIQERIGRRRAGTIFLVAAAILGAGAFQASGPGAVASLLIPAAFFAFGVSAVLSAMAAEIFPTGARAGALGFARGIFGTIGALAGPLAVAALGSVLPEIGDAVSLTAGGPLLAASLIWLLPETAHRELESISAAARIYEEPTRPASVPPRLTLPGVTTPPRRVQYPPYGQRVPGPVAPERPPPREEEDRGP